MKKLLLLLSILILTSCGKQEISQEKLKEYFKNHKVGRSSDYAVMKNSNDYLLTIHGYMDDREVCESLIKNYNEDPKLSVLPGTYSCIQLN
jgi:hypothetical protein